MSWMRVTSTVRKIRPKLGIFFCFFPFSISAPMFELHLGAHGMGDTLSLCAPLLLLPRTYMRMGYWLSGQSDKAVYTTV
ncbi:hypothetical protein HOY82DRAFT_569963, partial [Tuber indicum]